VISGHGSALWGAFFFGHGLGLRIAANPAIFSLIG
jgi:hypothetical protein